MTTASLGTTLTADQHRCLVAMVWELAAIEAWMSDLGVDATVVVDGKEIDVADLLDRSAARFDETDAMRALGMLTDAVRERPSFVVRLDDEQKRAVAASFSALIIAAVWARSLGRKITIDDDVDTLVLPDHVDALLGKVARTELLAALDMAEPEGMSV